MTRLISLEDQLLYAHHRVASSIVQVTPDDERRVVEVARSESGRSQLRAIQLLVELHSPRSVEVCSELLPRVDGRAAIACADALGRIGDPVAEEPLLAALSRKRDPSLWFAILGALARIGGTASLDRLSFDKKDGPADRSRRMFDFTRSVISHRLGTGIAPTEQPRTSSLTEPLVATAWEPLSGSAFDAVGRMPSGERFGVTARYERSFRLHCGIEWIVLLNEGFDIDSVRVRPRVLGVLVRRSPEDGHFSTSRVILSTPGADSVSIRVYRTDGALFATGRLHSEDHVLDIASLEGPGAAPFSLRAHLSNRTLHVIGFASQKRSRSLEPTSIEVPTA